MPLAQLQAPVLVVPPTPDPKGWVSVLVIDDDAFDRRKIRRLAGQTELLLEMEEVASIRSILPTLDRRRFDVILLDYQLPEGDGFQAMNAIRNHPKTESCPIIMVAGSSQPTLAAQAIKQGCDDFISKNDLTVQSLELSIATAVKKARTNVTTVQQIRREIARHVQGFLASQFACLQPEFERIVQDIQRVRHSTDLSRQEVLATLMEIEARCSQLQKTLSLNASQARKRLH